MLTPIRSLLQLGLAKSRRSRPCSSASERSVSETKQVNCTGSAVRTPRGCRSMPSSPLVEACRQGRIPYNISSSR